MCVFLLMYVSGGICLGSAFILLVFSGNDSLLSIWMAFYDGDASLSTFSCQAQYHFGWAGMQG